MKCPGVQKQPLRNRKRRAPAYVLSPPRASTCPLASPPCARDRSRSIARVALAHTPSNPLLRPCVSLARVRCAQHLARGHAHMPLDRRCYASTLRRKQHHDDDGNPHESRQLLLRVVVLYSSGSSCSVEPTESVAAVATFLGVLSRPLATRDSTLRGAAVVASKRENLKSVAYLLASL